MTLRTKKRSITKFLVFSLIPLFVLFICAELFSRIYLFAKNKDTNYLVSPFFNKEEPSEKKEEFDVDDFFKVNGKVTDKWYFKMKPGTYPAPQKYGYLTFTINSLGFRGKEFNPNEKGSRIRIFCIGPSTTFGAASSDDQTWPARLEYYLNADKKNRFEVINSGFPAAYSLNYINLIRYELINYKPDIFIVDAGENDLNRNLEKKDIGKFMDKMHEILYYRSMLYTLLLEKMSAVLNNSPIPMNVWNLTANENFNNNIEKIIDLCRLNNIKIIFLRQMLYTKKEVFLADNLSLAEIRNIQEVQPRDDKGIVYAHYAMIYRYNDMMKNLKKLSVKYSIKLVDFRKEFLGIMKDGNKNIFLDDVHLSSSGNDYLARLISQSILKDKALLQSE